MAEPRLDAIADDSQIDQPSGEKCYPIAATFTDVITDITQPKAYYISLGATEKATGNLVGRSKETQVVQVFKPVCYIKTNMQVWLREGPGTMFAERGVLNSGEPVFPLSSPLHLRELAPGSGDLWTLVTVTNDPRPGWIAHEYLNCPVPIDALPATGEIPATPTPTPTPSPIPTALPTATPTPPPEPTFTVSPKIIREGECAMLTWSIQNVEAVYLNGEGVAGEAEREVCPRRKGSHVYAWIIVNKDGSKLEKSVTLNVNEN
jgi:hypothetical protein